MTAPASAHPRALDDLYPGALALTDQLGEVPSRNRLMKEFKIGVPKATELRERLMEEKAREVIRRDHAEEKSRLTGLAPNDMLRAALDLADRRGHVPTVDILADLFGISQDRAEALSGMVRLARARGGLPTDPPAAEPDPVDPWDYAEPIGPDPVPTPADTEHDEPARPGRRWFRRRKQAKASPQVRVDGHPGTPTVTEPAPATAGELPQLKRIRWAVRLVLALGVAASIAGNVLHARDELISQIISAWSPLALLLTIELISRVPVHTRHLAVARWAATALIAGIAAWVSYWHMAAVASRYGETNGSQYLLPLSVDGLVVIASICLVELGGRIATANRAAIR